MSGTCLLPFAYGLFTPLPVCQSGRGKTVLRPPPLPKRFLQLKGLEPFDRTTTSPVFALPPAERMVPPTAVDQGSLAGKATERLRKRPSVNAPQSPLATKTVICSACVNN